MPQHYSPKEVDIPQRLNKMRSLYKDLFSSGKQYRGALVYMIGKEIHLDEVSSYTLAQTAEFIHNSSLLHDDVVDNAILRRGKTTAWKKYGGGYAVLAGDYLLSKVIKDLCQFSNLKLVEYTSETILKLVEGEWLQDDNHKKTNLTEDQVASVHRLKTGALFSWCFKAPFILKGLDEKECKVSAQLGEKFGALLQRSDDLLDFNIRNYEHKSFFKDLPSGNMNLFALKLLAPQSPEEKQKAYDFKSMEEFVSFYNFNIDEALKDYDEESEKIINDLKENINQISQFSEEFKKSVKIHG